MCTSVRENPSKQPDAYENMISINIHMDKPIWFCEMLLSTGSNYLGMTVWRCEVGIIRGTGVLQICRLVTHV